MFTAWRQHRRCFIPRSSAPEDGRNYRPKHVELIVIINKICYCCIRLAVYITISFFQCKIISKFGSQTSHLTVSTNTARALRLYQQCGIYCRSVAKTMRKFIAHAG